MLIFKTATFKPFSISSPASETTIYKASKVPVEIFYRLYVAWLSLDIKETMGSSKPTPGMTSAISSVVPQIILCLMMLGMSAHFTIAQLMLMDKICLSQYNEDICGELSKHEDIENSVQTETTRVNTNMQLLSMLPAGFVTLVLGPLSDIYGRKRIVLIPTVTTTFLALTMLYQSMQPNVMPSVLYIGSFLSGIGGGIMAFMSLTINYVTDSTPEEQRTEKLSKVLPFFLVGQIIGGLASGIVAEYIGTNTVYVIFVTTTLLTVFFIAVFMEDRKTTSESDNFSLQMIYSNVTAGGKALVAARPGTQRRQLLLLVSVTAVLLMICMAADMTLLPLYVARAPLEWTPVTLSYHNALKTIMVVVGQVVLTPLVLQVTGTKGIIGDFTLVIMGAIAGGIASAINALAGSTWIMMITVPIAVMFVGPSQPATSSLNSKLVLPSETGAMTAFCSFLNSLSFPIGTVVFSAIYSNTIQSVPSATFLTTAVFNWIGALLIMLARSYAIADMKKSEDKKS
ncbi:lysosomal proton-coupled steroid conjugate and bile acid symporter SLC46A3-like [Amphiura filiformis]|uniref:lysosomal proton-coupled steroid conjugate and bile acid symporter SLC46A3-like n=1 Tax=Amphiura filiformis TaxID=82378 RepID=UPI003B21B1F6